MTNPVDDRGNVRIDFAWGNMPLQPNDKRVAGSGGTYGAYGSTEDVVSDYDGGYPRANVAIPSNILDVKLDDHVRATGDFELGIRPGWNGYPGYEPNSTGDGNYSTFINTVTTEYTFTPGTESGADFIFAILRGAAWSVAQEIGSIYIEGAPVYGEVMTVLRSKAQWTVRLLDSQQLIRGQYDVTPPLPFERELKPVNNSFNSASANFPLEGYRVTQINLDTRFNFINVNYIPLV